MPRTIKQGDTRPELTMDLALEGSDLTGIASWRLLIKAGATTSEYADPDVAVDGDDPSTAVLTHSLVADDVATTGRHLVEVEGTWADGGTTTFPTTGTMHYDVVADLDA